MAKGKGRSANKKGRSELTPAFIQIEWWMLESDAFLALSANATKVLLYMLKRFNGFNNGQIVFGVRCGCTKKLSGKEWTVKNIGLGRGQIGRALKELEAVGFIACAKPSTFDQKRKTREWRLTWLPYNHKAPTKEFMGWKPAQETNRSPAGVPNTGIQAHHCAYVTEPISPFDLYRFATGPVLQIHRSAPMPHLITMGSGGERGVENTLLQDANPTNAPIIGKAA